MYIRGCKVTYFFSNLADISVKNEKYCGLVWVSLETYMQKSTSAEQCARCVPAKL
jgi:hypothetical protein